MKTLLIALNTKYIHSNLAVYCLKTYAENNGSASEIEIAEFTINQLHDDIFKDIYERKADVLAFSVYIWNTEMIKKLIADYHMLRPETPIWIGGPEVSFELEKTFNDYQGISGIMAGEGEKTFTELLEFYEGKRELKDVHGIYYHSDRTNTPIYQPNKNELDLSDTPFAYPELESGNTKNLDHKIVYYESSRGCPFRCSYCLSSVDHHLRFRDIEKVKRELQIFINAGIPQVKFVDRTFNCKKDHAMSIWKYIHENDRGLTNFHFEIGADLVNEEELSLMSKMRPGLIQLEIGVQSTNETTLREIRRFVKFEDICNVVNRIKSFRNIHQHLDLIAGLPYEDFESFSKSFDDVYSLKPDQLQLGFLKVLKGTYMYEKQQEYGLKYRQSPPYEVLSTNWISYDDILKLKRIENIVETYYNSGQYINTLNYLVEHWDRPFSFYSQFAEYFDRRVDTGVNLSRNVKYQILYDFVCSKKEELKDETAELLTLDLYLREPAKSRPLFASDEYENRTRTTDFSRQLWLKESSNSDNITDDLNRFERDSRNNASYRLFLHNTHQERFSFDIEKLIDSGISIKKETFVHFDYRNRDPLSGNCTIRIF